MNRAFEIRLYPTKEQQKLLDMTFGACRFVYNKLPVEPIVSKNISSFEQEDSTLQGGVSSHRQM